VPLPRNIAGSASILDDKTLMQCDTFLSEKTPSKKSGILKSLIFNLNFYMQLKSSTDSSIIYNETFENVRKIRPVQIAVAYLGMGWLERLGGHLPADLIIRPALGSNPDAIRDAIKCMGADHVHFLDELHAKVFIGQESALVGSANLSRNADEILREVMVKVTDAASMATLRKWFADTILLSSDQYSTTAAKGKRLTELQQLHNREIRSELKTLDKLSGNELKGESRPKHGLGDYLSNKLSAESLLSVQWWQDEGGHTKKFKADVAKQGHDYAQISDHLDITENDATAEIRDSWVLCWRQTSTGRATKKLEWLYVDGIADSGDKIYPRTIFMLEGKGRSLPPRPFEIDDAACEAFKKTMNESEWEALRDASNTEWLAENPEDGKAYLLSFLEAWRDNIAHGSG
jgi:hypothetical protein